MDIHLRVLSESYLMNTNMTWFRWGFSKIFASVYFGKKVASSLERLTGLGRKPFILEVT